MKSKKSDLASPLLWHYGDQPKALGCAVCPDEPICGGLSVAAGLMSCMDLCRCEDPSRCDIACKTNLRRFLTYVREVQGLELNSIVQPPVTHVPQLQFYVPHLFHGYSRSKPVISQGVAVCLSDIFSHKTGELLFKSKRDMASHFRFEESAELFVVGVDKDQPLEDYWSVGRAARIYDHMHLLQPALVSTPNFSAFSDVPRWNDLVNIKRIAKCWEELASRGLRASLHLNLRTDRDWERVSAFVRGYPAVQSVTCEFATGTASRRRAPWYVAHLLRLPEKAGRPLHLLLRGGFGYLRVLGTAFENLTYIDTTPWLRAISRFGAYRRKRNKLGWRPYPLLPGRPIDELLQHNIDLGRQRADVEIGRKRATKIGADQRLIASSGDHGGATGQLASLRREDR